MKKLLTLVLAFCMAFALCACGEETAENVTTTISPEEEAEANQVAADVVAALIDNIYVQTRTEDTDVECALAKAGWDALTEEQKAMVFGENADPDYFGRDTGDASLDDPRNEDGIGENELLVVSFGTSFNESRAEDIGGIEEALQEAYPEWSVRRAFTAQIIINHIQARDEEFIDNMDQALQRAVDNGVKNLVIQPTHLMHGAEYDELFEAVAAYEDKFENVVIAEPLLGEVGSNASSVNSDKEAVAKAISEKALEEAGFTSMKEATDASVAFVFMGHGTSHSAAVTYSQMQSQMDDLGYENVFIGTVEGKPEETSCDNIIASVHDAGYTTIILRPLMVVAGDHANNDMAGEDEDSWVSRFTASGFFTEVSCQIEGMGRIPAVQEVYIAHTGKALESLGQTTETSATDANDESALADGSYTVDFNTDSTMFMVNESQNGKGTLTVKDGEMTVHVPLVSKNIVNLFPGTAEEAENAEKSTLLQPTTDTVTYTDGTTEEVYGFNIPVPALDQEFALAIIGTKGVWYDHMVSVTNPVAK